MKSFITLAPIVLALAVVIGGVTAYVVNFNKFANCDFEAPVKCEVIHGIGLIPAFTLITVWFDSDK